MYLVPPMDDDPPPAYVAFVATHLRSLRAEADRLVGGDVEGAHVYLDVLTDVAGHWRRLTLRRRLTRRDAASLYLRRRLEIRTRHWRDDQVYPVEVTFVRKPAPVAAYRRSRGSLALQKAAVLPTTVRSTAPALADAGIAWVKACRKAQWHSVGRSVAATILLIAAVIQYMSWLSPAQ